MRKNNLLLLATCCTTFLCCKKSETLETANAQNFKPNLKSSVYTTNSGLTANFTSDHEKNLSIVYFVPTDLDTIPGYEKRLSEIILHGQNFYGTNMQAWGYGYKTFGLEKDPITNRLKIITVYGTKPKSSYTYDTGLPTLDAEVKAYVAAHPADFTSAHTLVILPAFQYNASGDPGGPPFFGYGRWCYALDYNEFKLQYLGQNTTLGNRLTKWMGGMMHEIGHGLNLPHNKELVSQANNPAYGIALMGAGNYTYGKSPTFLTAADCAILNTNQIFQLTNNLTYYSAVTAKINRAYAVFNAGTGNITVSGKFTTNTPVTNVVYYLDPNVDNEGTGTNKDYNANTWRSNVIGTDSFNVVIPISDLQVKGTTPYELKVKLVHQNGTVSQTIYPFDFVNNVPVINIINELDKSAWSVIAYSSQESSYPASNLIDDKQSNYWRSKYTSAPAAVLPHSFRIDMGSVKTLHGFSFSQRSDGLKTVKNIEVQVSNSPSANFVSVGTFQVPNNNQKTTFAFSSVQSARYFRLVVTSNWDGTNDSGIGEVGMY